MGRSHWNAPLVASVSLLVVLIGCGRADRRDFETATAGKRPPEPSANSDLAAPRPRIVLLGDSLTAGLGLPREAAYPSQLQARIDARGLSYEVVNAGVSGDTSAAGVSRLDWALAGDVRVLVVALGANDGLRGLPVEQLEKNLDTIIRRAQERHIRVVLAGMEAPPNLGPAYARAFHDVYSRLARTRRVPLVPFLLDGVAGVASLNQADGIHPTPAGARIVADNVWRVLEPILSAIDGESARRSA